MLKLVKLALGLWCNHAKTQAIWARKRRAGGKQTDYEIVYRSKRKVSGEPQISVAWNCGGETDRHFDTNSRLRRSLVDDETVLRISPRYHPSVLFLVVPHEKESKESKHTF
jgi:hypothetical protein